MTYKFFQNCRSLCFVCWICTTALVWLYLSWYWRWAVVVPIFIYILWPFETNKCTWNIPFLNYFSAYLCPDFFFFFYGKIYCLLAWLFFFLQMMDMHIKVLWTGYKVYFLSTHYSFLMPLWVGSHLCILLIVLIGFWNRLPTVNKNY